MIRFPISMLATAGALLGLGYFTVWSYVSPGALTWYLERGWAGESFSVVSPAEGSELATQTTQLRGTGRKPTVEISNRDGLLVEAKVGWDGRWNATVPTRDLIGEVKFIENSASGAPGEVIVKRYQINAPGAPEVIDPESNPKLMRTLFVGSHADGDRVYVGTVVFEGKARPNAVIQGWRDTYAIGKTQANAQGEWRIVSNLRAPGKNRKFKFEDANRKREFQIVRLDIIR